MAPTTSPPDPYADDLEDLWLRRRWPKLGGDPAKRAAKREKQRRLAPYMQLVFLVVYATLFMLLYSAYQTSRAGYMS